MRVAQKRWVALSFTARRNVSDGPIFNNRHQGVLDEERAFLSELAPLLSDVGASEEDQKLVQQLKRQLDELFLVVVVGEFNSGKSSLINGLLGSSLLAEGVTPTTDKINMIKFGEEGKDYSLEDGEYAQQDLCIHRFNVPWLKEINVVDTPGTNAVFEKHQVLTEEFMPRSDLVLFVSSCDRPFSASEKSFLEKIFRWNRRFAVVLNKVDLLETPEDKEKVVSFVRKNLESYGGEKIPVFPVAARKFLRGHKEEGFIGLQEYILKTLSSEERAIIKLRSPLLLVNKLMQKYEGETEKKVMTLGNDAKVLEKTNQSLDAWRKEITSEFEMYQKGLSNILLEIDSRAVKFLDQHMVMSNLYQLLMKQDVLKNKFEKEVLGDFSREVDRHLDVVVDWMVDKSAREFQRQVKVLTSSILLPNANTDSNSFTSNRADLAAAVTASASMTLSSLDRERVSSEMTETIRKAAMSFAAIEIGAVGVAGILSAAIVDVTGVLGVSAIAATGLAVLPYRKRQIKARMQELIADMRRTLARDLKSHFDKHIMVMMSQVKSVATPYSTYVKTESESLKSSLSKLKEADAKVSEIFKKLEKD